MNRIGIDIGGTFIKGGIVNDQGKILFSTKIATFNKERTVIDNLYKLIISLIEKNKVISNDQISYIGLGVPGIINREKGIAEFSGNLSWNNIPIIEILKSKGITIPIGMCNDSRTACIGETMFGAGKKYKNAVIMTIGTGIGAGVIINGKLFSGNGDKGGEIGHAILIIDGEECTCGRKGCFEAYAGARALIRDAKKQMLKDKTSLMWKYVHNAIENVDGNTAFACAKEQDESAIYVINNYIKYLGEGLLNVCNCFRPEAIIIGGGISEQGEYLFSKLNNYVKEHNYGYKCTPKVKIIKAKLGNRAGIIGAAFINDFFERK